MAPHLTSAELDFIHGLAANKGLTAREIHQRLASRRRRKGAKAPHITNVRRAIRGKTYRRGHVETRGRKKKLSAQAVRKINATRRTLIQKAKGEQEVHWKQILKAARVDVHKTTASRSLKEAGYDVQWRRPREKPLRTPAAEALRAEIAGRWRRRPVTFFTEALDLIMDNKRWEIPTHAAAVSYSKMKKVRGHLRTREEGLSAGYTKPNTKKHCLNPGASVLICAGVINCKVKIWRYLPGNRWNGEAAAETYRKTIYPALKRHRGEKASYCVLEDNDPTGYKSNKAIAVKSELGITGIQFPTYSPDLNPMDYFLWAEVEKRMAANAPAGRESAAKYKARLRRTAMGIPADVIRKGVAAIKGRAQAIFEADGGNIPQD